MPEILSGLRFPDFLLQIKTKTKNNNKITFFRSLNDQLKGQTSYFASVCLSFFICKQVMTSLQGCFCNAGHRKQSLGHSRQAHTYKLSNRNRDMLFTFSSRPTSPTKFHNNQECIARPYLIKRGRRQSRCQGPQGYEVHLLRCGS